MASKILSNPPPDGFSCFCSKAVTLLLLIDVAIYVLCLFLSVPFDGLWFKIVAFPGHTHLLYLVVRFSECTSNALVMTLIQFLASGVFCHLQTVLTQIRTDRMLVLIWILKEFSEKVYFEKNQQMAIQL